MAFGKSFASPEEQYAFKIIDYFYALWQIDDGEQKLAKALDGEALIWDILEGSEYEKSKSALYRKIDSRRKDKGITHSKLHLANAIIKLQKRSVLASGVLGKRGITVIQQKQSDEETKKLLAGLDDLEDNEDAT